MPYHIAPPIRALEEMRETAGLLPARNTPAVTTILAQESGSTRFKLVPKFFVRYIFGTKYTAS